ncbi:MAG: electron transfer flavoprotein beta subunit/FixA family protein [Marinifilaceae bacterium]
MKILLCLSNVPDTTTKIRFVESDTQLDTANVQWIINPWDEFALTRALELKEDTGNPVNEVCVVNVGTVATEPTIRKTLAIGADRAVRIDAEPLDAYFVAYQIAEFIKKEPFDIILCGIESSDYNGSSVGSMLAEFLDCPSISSVTTLDFDGDQLQVARAIPGGKQVMETQTPFVAVVQKGISQEPRIPSMRGIMMARKKPLQVMEAAPGEALTKCVKYELPQAKAACKMVEAENVDHLVDLLYNEAKIL